MSYILLFESNLVLYLISAKNGNVILLKVNGK